MHYLDHASHSWPKPAAVYQALDDFAHVCSQQEARQVIDAARQELSELLRIARPERIQFMTSRAEAFAQALQSIDWQNGDGIVISALEHQSILDAVMRLARTQGIQLYIVPYSHALPFDTRECEALLKQYPHIRLIALSHASHVIGCVLPIPAIADLARRYGKLFLLDATQTAGFWPLNLQQDKVDMLILSGEKALQGPRGLTMLYLAEGIKVKDGHGLPADELPLFSRIAALTEGVRWVRSNGNRQHVHALFSRLLTELDSIPEVSIYGMVERTDQLPLLSFNLLGHHPEVLAERLYQEFGIWLRAGLHQSRFAHEAIGAIHRGGTLRVSLGYASREEDVLALSQAIKTILVASSENRAWSWVAK